MISATAIQKHLIELKQEKLTADILVITISQNGFEAATFTKAPHTITKIAASTIKESIKQPEELSDLFIQFITETGLQKQNFHSILINWLGEHFTLVPSSFYDPEKAREMLEFNVGPMEGETILTNEVNDIKFIYSVPTELKNVLDRTFPNHNFKHIGYSSLKLFLSHFQLKNADVFVNIHEGQTELLIKKDKRPVLYNMFRTHSDEDVLYYLMFSVEQFDLDPLHLKLYVAANRDANDALFVNLKKYIRNVEFTISDKLIIRKEAFEQMPHHNYFSVLNRLLCE
jgi:hypothetical protein